MANNKTPTSNPKGTTDIRKMTDAELQKNFGGPFNNMVQDESMLTHIYDTYLDLGFNFFAVSDMARREIKHSKVLSWFLRPSENPGAGGFILQELLKLPQIGWNNLSEPDCETFTVINEEFNIDILIYSEKLKKVVVIENKIDAAERTEGEDGGQLEKYYNYIKNSPKYKDCKDDDVKFIFLSPDGRKPSAKNEQIWKPMKYAEIKTAIETGWSNATNNVYDNKPNAKTISEIDVFVEHYIKLIERSLIMTTNKEFRDKCVDFYKHHRDVLDAMFVIVKDAARQINDFIQVELGSKRELIWDEQINTNTSRYFTTPFLNQIAKKEPGKKADCMYEILTTNTDGSVLKCTLFRKNEKAEVLRKLKLNKSTEIKSFPVSFTLIKLSNQGFIDEWLQDPEQAKLKIPDQAKKAIEELVKFEQEAQNFLNKNS